MSHRRVMMTHAPNQDWTSRGFLLENVAKGVLQAIASLAVYAIAIWIIIANSGHLSFLSDALKTKIPVLNTM